MISEIIFPWQTTQWEQFNRLRQLNRLPHAVLFSGIAGIAQALAPLLPETSVKIQGFLSASPLKKPVAPLFARRD